MSLASLPDLHIGLRLLDAKGRVVYQRREQGHSWTHNGWLRMLAALTDLRGDGQDYGVGHGAARALNGTVYNQSGSTGARSASLYNQGLLAPESAGNYGILIGTGRQQFNLADYTLSAPVSHSGTGMQHQAMLAPSAAFDAANQVWTVYLTRRFANQSGARMTIQEIGLAWRGRLFSAQEDYFLLARDVLESAIDVPAGLTLEVTYEVALSAAGSGAGTRGSLPVLPNAWGFGIGTPGGRGGQILTVNSLSADPLVTGSLPWALNQSGPRIIVFETSGVLTLEEDLEISEPYLTLAAQTAPSPGFTLAGGGLMIRSHDVLVQHLRVRPGDGEIGPSKHNRDALMISGQKAGEAIETYNVVLDHCSFAWSTDEMASGWFRTGGITLSHCIFGEALDNAGHPDGNHGLGVLFGGFDKTRVCLHGNLLAHQRGRNPLSRAPEAVITNNLVYDWATSATQLSNASEAGEDGPLTYTALISNVYQPGPSLTYLAPPIQLVGTTAPWRSGSKLYLLDNTIHGEPWWTTPVYDAAEQATLVENAAEDPHWRAVAPPVVIANMQLRPSSKVREWVLENAGARPLDRDAIDARIVQNVKDGTGGLVPNLTDGVARLADLATAVNVRALTLPELPHATLASGYSAIEALLHWHAQRLEGFTPEALFTQTYGTIEAMGAWYDATDITTLFQDVAGTVPAVVGQPVALMLDKSGNGLHAVQESTEARKRPILRRNTRGVYYLDLNNLSDFETGFVANTAREYVGTFALAPTSLADDYAFGVALNDLDSRYRSWLGYLESGQLRAGFGNASWTSTALEHPEAVVVPGGVSVVSLEAGEGTARVYKHGIEVGSFTYTGLDAEQPRNHPLGVAHLTEATGKVAWVTGEFYGAVFLRERPLSAAERLALARYLARKAAG